MARELLAAKPDALFTCTTRVTEAAQAATKTVPIVFAWVADPVASGLVKAYAKPDGNITGVTNRFGELLVKRLELARELLPAVKRVAVVGGIQGTPYEAVGGGLRKAATALGIELLETPVQGNWVAAVDAAAKNGAEASVSMHLYSIASVSGAEIIQYAIQNRFPVVHADAQAVENGGLISYGTNLIGDVQRGADLLARVLRGDKPATLPVDQAARFELVVNLKTAKTLGITIPPSIMLRADRVIE